MDVLHLNLNLYKFAAMFFSLFRNLGIRACGYLLTTIVLPGHLLAKTSIVEIDSTSARKSHLEIELRNDNDMYLFNLQDQYYTNGLYLNIRKSVEKSKLKPSETNRLWEFSAGHQIFNAYTAQIDSIEAVDRPITGHLFLRAGAHHYFGEDQLLSYGVQVGTIGKRAGGEFLQGRLHYALNMYHAAGWEFQLNNAWGANVFAQHNVLIGRAKGNWIDMAFNSHLIGGTQDIRIKAGPILRLGQLNSYSQSAHFGARLQSSDRQAPTEWYFYYKPEANVVFYDATLQGGRFVSDKGPITSEPKRWLISNHFGAVYAFSDFSFKVQYFFNTKEADQSFFRHQYGSLAVAVRF